jgi:hypothetical protein
MSHINAKQSMQTLAHAAVGGDSSKSSGVGTAINAVVDPNGGAKVVCVKVHFNTAVTTSEELTIHSEDLDEGSTHSFVYFTQNAQSLTDIVFTDPIFLHRTERLVVSFANTDAVTWGLTVLYGE